MMHREQRGASVTRDSGGESLVRLQNIAHRSDLASLCISDPDLLRQATKENA